VLDAGYFLPGVKPEVRVRRGDVLGALVRSEDFREIEVQAPLDAFVYLVGAISPGADVSLASMMPFAKPGGRVARLLPR